MFLHLDIETIPTDDPDVVKRLICEIEAPGNYKDPEKINEYKLMKSSEVVAKTALDGAYGRIAVIGFAFDDEDPVTYKLNDFSSEKAMISTYFEIVGYRCVGRRPTVVGHNIVGFDLRFVLQRALVHGLRVPAWFPIDPKPWGDEVIDTMIAWAGARGTVSQDKLCRVLGVEGKGDIDGSMVAGLWAEGRYDEVGAYCADDVRRQREVAMRILRCLGRIY